MADPPQAEVETRAAVSEKEVDTGVAHDASTPVALDDAAIGSEAAKQARRAWPRVAVDDASPLCLFSDLRSRDAAPFRKQAGKKQSLRADSSVVFGAYAPLACVNEQCDDVPTLQCWVEQEGGTLTVHSRYRAVHKPDSRCTENCREVTAACSTPALTAGTYTVKHGAKTMALKIPSVLRSSCLPGD